MGMRRRSTAALLRPFSFFPSLIIASPSPTTARTGSSSCLQLQIRRLFATTTTTYPFQLQHRCQIMSSSRYCNASHIAHTRHRYYRRSSVACHLQHRLTTPLLLSIATRQASSSSTTPGNDTTNNINNIVISTDELQANFLRLAKSMSESLSQHGYWTNHDDDDDINNSSSSSRSSSILPPHAIATLRKQAIALRNEGRYEPSYSESVSNALTGETVRFDKPGVFACEPDGADYETAPDMLLYMTVLLRTLPPALNDAMNNNRNVSGGCSRTHWKLDNTAFNAKLAVTQSGGSKYPRHVDNVEGIHVGSNDLRKLTAILYLNPDWTRGDGGELRLYLQPPPPLPSSKETSDGNNHNNKEKQEEHVGEKSVFVDLSPVGGRLVLFYSDEVPHEVLENAPHAKVEDDKFDRYALTIWIPASQVE